MKREPRIGKHILDTLTSGMYEDALMLYREYVQNAADQIDLLTEDERAKSHTRATIVVDIDPIDRSITITDKATGIPEKKFADKMLDIASSEKDPSVNKGFRGIGRLAGLTCCNKLIFETSAREETSVSKVEMNGEELRRILNDNSDQSSAVEVIDKISTLSRRENASKSYDSFFKVTLLQVGSAWRETLLNVEKVKNFLAQVAPVAFSPTKFSYESKIKEWTKENNIPFCEYELQVNGDAVLKPYKDVIYDASKHVAERLQGILFHKIVHDGKLLAWIWYAPQLLGRSIADKPNPERKIRLRKHNIQIGKENFFDGYFRQDRSGGYMIGEVHIVSPEIQPNGDRMGLETSAKSEEFLEELRSFFKDLWNGAEVANDISSAVGTIEEYKKLHQKTKELLSENTPAAIQEAKCAALASLYDKSMKAQEKLSEVQKKKYRGETAKWTAEQLKEKCGTLASEELATPLYPQLPKPTGPSIKLKREKVRNDISGILLKHFPDDVERVVKIVEEIDAKLFG